MAACCAERGYRAVSIADVTTRASLSRESFERHFESKEDLALAALNQVVSETLAAVATAPTGADEGEHWLLRIRAILELMEARLGFARLVCIDARQSGTARMRDAYEGAAHVLALMVERSSGPGGGVPTSAARAALGGAEAVVRRALCGGDEVELSRYLPDFLYAALVPFVGQGEALRQSRAAAKLLTEEE